MKTNTNKTILYVWWVILLLAGSCDVGGEEELPTYVRVEPIRVESTPGSGSTSAKITEAWVFLNNDFAGAYDLPATVPLLGEGEQTVLVQAGIKDNGLFDRPEIYPFYSTDSFRVDLAPLGIDTVRPRVQYLPSVEFSFIEDFEDGDSFFSDDIDGNPETTVSITTESDEVFEGDRSGKIVLTADNALVQVATSAAQKITDIANLQSPFVYLEINYKSDVDVIFGVIAHPSGLVTNPEVAFEAGFLANEEWNKIYLNFSSLIVNLPAPEYQIILSAGLPVDGSGNFIEDRGVILLDNIKLVHF